MSRYFAAALVVLAAPASLAGDLVWDNYPGDSYDTSVFYSAERNTMAGPSYAVDDVVFTLADPLQVRISSLEWVGLREKLTPPKGYDKADFTILTRDPVTGVFSEVPQLAGGLGMNVNWSILKDDLATVGKYTAYEGRITLGDQGIDIVLDPGEYWFGMRLVANPAALFTGRNFLASADEVNPLGSAAGGYIFNPPAGVTSYIPASTVFGTPVDFAFRVGYEIIPEPASLALLALGCVICAVRRRL